MSMKLETLNEVIKIHGMKCVLTGDERVNFHHNHQFAGKSNQNPYFIIPIAKRIHDIIHGHGVYTSEQRKEYQDRLDYYMLINAPEAVLKEYSKVVDLVQKRDGLIKHFTMKYEK